MHHKNNHENVGRRRTHVDWTRITAWPTLCAICDHVAAEIDMLTSSDFWTLQGFSISLYIV